MAEGFGFIESGIIITGQNWNGMKVLKNEKKVLEFFGFKVPSELSWNWQFTKNLDDESRVSYKKSDKVFRKTFGI